MNLLPTAGLRVELHVEKGAASSEGVMKTSNVILIGAVVIALVVLAVRESTRTGAEQARSSVTSAEWLPAPRETEQIGTPASAAERSMAMSTRRQQTSVSPAQEESPIAGAPQGYEQGRKTQKDQEQTQGSPPVPADVFDRLVSSGSSVMPIPAEAFARRFSEEEPDPNWSPNVEFQLQGSLLNEEATKLFDVVSMGCRKTVCEIRAVAPSKEMNAQSLDALQDRIFTMPRESWWTGYGLKVPSVVVMIGPDGRAVMVAHVATH